MLALLSDDEQEAVSQAEASLPALVEATGFDIIGLVVNEFCVAFFWPARRLDA